MNNTNDSEVTKNFEIGDELQDANGKNNADAVKSYFGKMIFGVRKSFAAKCEQSVLSQLIESLYYLILSLPMKVFGIYLTSFGLSALIFKYVTDYNGFAFFTDVDTVTIICFLITGIVMLPAGKSFGELLSGSKFFSQFSIVYSQSALMSQGTKHFKSFDEDSTSLFLGIISGILSFFYPAPSILLLFLSLMYVIFIFNRPECGLMFTAFVIPFLNGTTVLFLTIITFTSLIFKYLRGKRHITLNTLHIIFVVSIIFVILKGYFTYSGERSLVGTVSVITFILACIMTVSLSRSTSMLYKGINIIISVSRLYTVILVCYYIGTIIFGASDASQFLESISFGGVFSAVTSKQFLIPFLAVSIPLNFAETISSKNAAGFIKSIIFFSLMLACTVFADSFIFSLITLLSCVLILSFIKTKFAVFVVPCPLIALGMTKLYDILPGSLLLSSSAIDSSSADSIYTLIRENLLFGIGFGDNNLLKSLSAVSTSTGSLGRLDNAFLNLLLEIGVIGVVILAVLICIMLIKVLTFIRNNDSPVHTKSALMSTGLFAASLSFIACCFITDCVSDFRTALLFAFIISLSYASGQCIEADYIDPTTVREFKQH